MQEQQKAEYLDAKTHAPDVQALIVMLINRLLSAEVTAIDAAIEDCLRELGEYSGRDRTYVFVLDGDFLKNTHEWCAPGIAPMIDSLQRLPVADFGSLMTPLLDNKPLLLPDIRDLPTESEDYRTLDTQDIRSMLLVPTLENGELFGFVGFDSVTQRGEFRPSEIYLLRAFADVVRAVLVRRSATTAMQSAQQELAQERAFLQGIVTTNVIGVLVFDEKGKVFFANDASSDILGLKKSALIGRPHDALHPAITDLDGAAVPMEQEPFLRVQRDGRHVQNHRIALHHPANVRYLSVNAAPIKSASHERPRVVYALTDVTALVEAEQAREAALKKAHRANAAKSNFLANMSHEIRTPLNGILGIGTLLDDALTDRDHKEMVRILQDSGKLLMAIIDDLLDMSKIEADALELEQIPFDLAALARRVRDVYGLRTREKGLCFEVDLHDPAGATRIGDPHRLMQILHNLLGNAVKFTEAGRIRLTLEASDPTEIVVTVQDTGIGMSADHLARLFDPFAQADSSISRRFGGTGLGMSIVKRLVGLMGGDLQIDSALGAGTRNTITLPLPATSGPGIDVVERAPDAGPNGLQQLRVLAVDDNRTNRIILERMLTQLGAQVVLGEDGPAALEQYCAGNFDVMIFDISMPGMDGMQLLDRIRDLERSASRPRVPALAFTANAMAHQLEGYLQAGFEGCLTKPLQAGALQETLGRVVSRG